MGGRIKLSKVRFWDYVKFFLGNWILAFFGTLIMMMSCALTTGEVMNLSQIMISAFGLCIMFMLTDIWKEIKEAKQNGK